MPKVAKWNCIIRTILTRKRIVAYSRSWVFLQRSKKRGQLRSGVLNFDSGRSFEQVKPYAYSWNFTDPSDEDLAWAATLNPMKSRFEDVVHSMFRKVRSQKETIAKKALALHLQGATSMPLDFGDPLEPFKRAFSQLLPGKRLLDVEENGQNLHYLQGGQKLDLNRLSSGEREVVTVVFDFLLRNPEDCIVVFDEPELHLHPELSFRLIRTLQDVGIRNQFIFCTHSPDIITASLDQTVVFIGPARETGPDGVVANQALLVREGDETSTVLRALGQSIGVISLGRKIVLIEGERTSLDKETYGSILGSTFADLVLVPVGGKDRIAVFEGALATILDKTIWGVDFFMLCDGDSSAGVIESAATASEPGRLRKLSRYHLENYFLDEYVWAIVTEQLAHPAQSPMRDPSEIRKVLRNFASNNTSFAVALRVSHRIRQMVGNVDIMPKGSSQVSKETLSTAFEGKLQSELSRVTSALNGTEIAQLVSVEFATITSAIDTDSDDWKVLIPGRQVVQQFAKHLKIDYGNLKRMYIRAALTGSVDPFQEIREIFRDFQSA